MIDHNSLKRKIEDTYHKLTHDGRMMKCDTKVVSLLKKPVLSQFLDLCFVDNSLCTLLPKGTTIKDLDCRSLGTKGTQSRRNMVEDFATIMHKKLHPRRSVEGVPQNFCFGFPLAL
jgi:hypothetical protein